MIVHITFAGVLVLQKDTQPWIKWVFDLDFLKHANDGVAQAILGYDRKLQCDKIYCHFEKPQVFLKMVGAPENPLQAIYAFPIIFIIVHLLAFFIMNNRLKR
jgi:uncharacterized Zn-finger protein